MEKDFFIKNALKPSELTNKIPPSWFRFKTTANLPAHKGIPGQPRAMFAIKTGLEAKGKGFNIFVVGDPGVGKTATLEKLLANHALKNKISNDLVFVYNFRHPDNPKPIELPNGAGISFKKETQNIYAELEKLINRALSDGTFGHIKGQINDEASRKNSNLLNKAARDATSLNLYVEEVKGEFIVSPLIKNKPVSKTNFEKLSLAKRRKIKVDILKFQEKLDSYTTAKRQIEIACADQLYDAEIRAIRPLVNGLLDEACFRYRKISKDAASFLTQLKEYVFENHRIFFEESEFENELEMPLSPRLVFTVNLVVDRHDDTGAPVVVDRMPSATNLCGYIEFKDIGSGVFTDYTMIHPGSLHRANGGYLMIQAADLLAQENAWESLKRALRYREIHIDESTNESKPKMAGALKPLSVPLNVKVILVGSYETYYSLQSEDEEFDRLFKIQAHFEPSMKRTKENTMELVRFLGQVCREEKYLPLNIKGVKRILEFASRKAEHKNRLTTCRAGLLDLMSEANFYALENKAKSIDERHVKRAIKAGEYRMGSVIDALDREFKEGSILINLEGTAVGQVNGIALYEMPVRSFGVPVRITARTYAGSRGIVNIDREVRLSGAIHDKGAMILIGYLGGKYALRQTLGFSASVTFEQSYDEIDGDSASGAELFALISALSNCPLKQGIAVTGSVNQLGEIQSIGGVNEKIEGIFSICKGRGLTGEHGVMIPRANVNNLMLDKEVIDAVKEGKFNIYVISTVDEGIEVLTGMNAGKQLRNGDWSENSIAFHVQNRLRFFGEILRKDRVLTSFDKKL